MPSLREWATKRISISKLGGARAFGFAQLKKSAPLTKSSFGSFSCRVRKSREICAKTKSTQKKRSRKFRERTRLACNRNRIKIKEIVESASLLPGRPRSRVSRLSCRFYSFGAALVSKIGRIGVFSGRVNFSGAGTGTGLCRRDASGKFCGSSKKVSFFVKDDYFCGTFYQLRRRKSRHQKTSGLRNAENQKIFPCFSF